MNPSMTSIRPSLSEPTDDDFILTIDHVVQAARQLASDTGENPEYDRALVEMTADLLGVDKSISRYMIFGR